MPLGAFLRFLPILYDFLGFVVDFWSKKLCNNLYFFLVVKIYHEKPGSVLTYVRTTWPSLGALGRFVAFFFHFFSFLFLSLVKFWQLFVSKKLCNDLYRFTMLKGGENLAGQAKPSQAKPSLAQGAREKNEHIAPKALDFFDQAKPSQEPSQAKFGAEGAKEKN